MKAYQIKATVKNTKPPVWRRLLIPAGIKFSKLCEILNIAMEHRETAYVFEFKGEKRAGRDEIIDTYLDEFDRFNLYQDEVYRVEVIERIEECKMTLPYLQKTDRNSSVDLDLVNNKLLKSISRRRRKSEGPARVMKRPSEFEKKLLEGEDEVDKNQIEFTVDEQNELKVKEDEEKKEIECGDVSDISTAGRIDDVLKKYFSTVEKNMAQESIYTALDAYSKDDLMEIAEHTGLDNFDGLKKDELKNMVVDSIQDPRRMREYFMCATDIELDTFRAIIDGERIGFDRYENVEYFFDGGYIFFTDNFEAVAPKEIRDLYRSINTESYIAKRREFRKIADYCVAANNLYGITPVEVLRNIISQQNDIEITTQELLKVYKMLSKYNCDFVYLEPMFVHKSLLEDKMYQNLYVDQKDKPFYIPEKEEFLKYIDNKYFENTREVKAFKLCLMSTLNIEVEYAATVCNSIQTSICFGGQIEELFTELDELGISTDNKRTAREIVKYTIDLYNGTRRLENRGYSMNQITSMDKESNVVPFIIKPDKVYPDVECPCGSGLKYKYCCGRVRKK